MSFEKLGLCSEILKSIKEKGYVNPTEIQERAIPQVLMGRDLLGCAQTGTGKTGSFIMPIIEILNTGKAKSRMPRSLVLAPTRELAMQVSEEFNLINKHLRLQMALLIGGISFVEQDNKLAKGVDVLIATPGRLLDHMERGKVILKDLKILVIDEADRMLDMGFIPDIIKINKMLPKIRQTLFFSATLSNEIRNIGKNFLINPKEISISPHSSTSSNIESFLIKTIKNNKLNDLRKILNIEQVKNAVIFCNRKVDINKVNTFLKRYNFKTVCLHGDMSQSSRIQSLEDFKDGLAKILIASDVAARGIDVAGLSHVFNYDVPINPEDYVHRIGRTGRAGLKGKAFTFCEDGGEKNILTIEKLIKKSIQIYHLNDINSESTDFKNISSEQNNQKIKETNKKIKKVYFLPIENFINFKESGQIPNFLTKK
ncbi:DEAD/DEAH box helicase [Alphaproteobacteria bacterium]|nr:DEAD/DEAH box helicase [Alphaproteobacteria bacterium]